jgi:predicted dehydrogenase
MEKPRVALIGASGIGQHHARWYHLAGAEVEAFAGTSRESCEKTAAALRASFGFQGRSYWNPKEMLDAERPDIVAVCSPTHLHRNHTLAALDANAHVLCEKPLVWDPTQPPQDWLRASREMIDRACERGRLFGMTPQVAAAVPFYRELYERVRGGTEPVRKFHGEFRNRSRKGRKRYEELWCDVSPHLLALIIEMMPDGDLDPSTLRGRIAEHETRVDFDWVGPEGRSAVHLELVDLAEGDPVRRFGVNGLLADWGGFRDEAGIYRSILKHGDTEIRSDDFLHVVIADFVERVRGTGGRVWVDGPAALRNMETLVAILEGSTRV